MAILHNSYQLIECMLTHGADVFIRLIENKTLLHYAVIMQNEKIAKLLLDFSKYIKNMAQNVKRQASIYLIKHKFSTTSRFSTHRSQESSIEDHSTNKALQNKVALKTFDMSKLQKFIRSIKILDSHISKSMMSSRRSSANISNQMSRTSTGVFEKNIVQLDINKNQESEYVNW